MVPAGIVGEALGQLGAWVVMAANDFTLRPVAGLVGDVSILDQARRGDMLLLDTTIDSVNREAVVYHAVATVGGVRVLTLENALGPLLPMEQFSDPDEVRAQFRAIDRPGRAAELAEAPPDPAIDAAAGSPDYSFDRVLSRERGKQVVAVKRIPDAAPFFNDHFPRKPVFPLSLLLECLLQLGAELLDEETPGPPRPVRICNVKMSQFVPPGKSLVAKVRVRDRSDQRARLRFRCEVDGRRVCIAEAEFSADTPIVEA